MVERRVPVVHNGRRTSSTRLSACEGFTVQTQGIASRTNRTFMQVIDTQAETSALLRDLAQPVA